MLNYLTVFFVLTKMHNIATGVLTSKDFYELIPQLVYLYTCWVASFLWQHYIINWGAINQFLWMFILYVVCCTPLLHVYFARPGRSMTVYLGVCRSDFCSDFRCLILWCLPVKNFIMVQFCLVIITGIFLYIITIKVSKECNRQKFRIDCLNLPYCFYVLHMWVWCSCAHTVTG